MLEAKKLSSRFRAFYIVSLAVTGIGLIGTPFVPRAHADSWNKMAIVKISEPIIAADKVLDPGTYVSKLLDFRSDRHAIFCKDQKHVEESHLFTMSAPFQSTP